MSRAEQRIDTGGLAGPTLEDFLRRPDIDEKPYKEYFDGRIEAKVSPQSKHSAIQAELVECLNAHVKPRHSGRAFPELRCTFAGRSLVPDVVFLLREHIELDPSGEYANEVSRPPDIHVEIVSPDQAVAKLRRRLAFSTGHGCPLGWLIDPERKAIDVYRAGGEPERLPADGALNGEPVLPGFAVAVSDVFGWLKPAW